METPDEGPAPKRFRNQIDDITHELPAIRLELGEGKWVTVSESGATRSATGRYLYVIAEDGTIYVSRRIPAQIGSEISHAEIAGGRDVLYAGEIQFSGRTNRGTVKGWNNGSGHYRPGADLAHQAGLPMDLFTPIRT
jgi:uncharacterized protein with HEPN domain